MRDIGTAYSCHWKIKFGAEWGIGHDWEKKKNFTYNRIRKPKNSTIWFVRESSRKENREWNSMEIEVKLFAMLRDYLPKGSGRFSCKMEVDRQTRGIGYFFKTQNTRRDAQDHLG